MTPLGEPTAGPREASSGEAGASLPPAKSESPEPSPSVSEPGPGARQASLLLNLFMSFRHRLLCPQMTPPGSPGPSCPGRRPPTPYAVAGSGRGRAASAGESLMASSTPELSTQRLAGIQPSGGPGVSPWAQWTFGASASLAQGSCPVHHTVFGSLPGLCPAENGPRHG